MMWRVSFHWIFTWNNYSLPYRYRWWSHPPTPPPPSTLLSFQLLGPNLPNWMTFFLAMHVQPMARSGSGSGSGAGSGSGSGSGSILFQYKCKNTLSWCCSTGTFWGSSRRVWHSNIQCKGSPVSVSSQRGKRRPTHTGGCDLTDVYLSGASGAPRRCWEWCECAMSSHQLRPGWNGVDALAANLSGKMTSYYYYFFFLIFEVHRRFPDKLSICLANAFVKYWILEVKVNLLSTQVSFLWSSLADRSR